MKVPAKTKIELMKEINELRAQFKGTKKKFSTSAEAQAQSSETTARSILDQATDMIIVCDENGKITRTSEVTHRYISGKFLLNKPFDAVLKLRFSSLHPLRQGNFSVSGILAGKILKKEEVTLQTEGQSFYFLLSARPLKDRRGRIGGCVVTLTEIGERKQMEAEFARLASFPQLNPNPIVEVDLAGNVQYSNPAAEQLFPDLRKTGLNHPWLMDLEKIAGVLERQPKRTHIRELNIEGIWHQQIIQSVMEGTRLRIYGFDITSHKQAEARLAADLAALTRMHALSRRLLGTEGFQPLFQEIMDAAVAIVGAERGTLQLLEGDSLRIVTHHGHRQPFLEFFARAENRASVCGEATRRGERVVVPDVETNSLFAGTPSLTVLREAGVRAVQSTPMVSRTGTLLGILTTQWSAPYTPDEHDLWRIDLLARQAADLIEYAKGEEALRESEERYRSLVESSPDGIAVHTDEKYSYINPAGARLFGAMSPNEVIGRKVLDFVHPDYRRSVEGRIRAILEHGVRTAPYESKILCMNGQIVDVEASGSPILYQGKRASQVIFRDITERKQMEEELRRSRDELEIRIQERTRELREQARTLDSFFKLSITPFVILDRDFNFIRVNKAYAKAGHRDASEFLGHNHFEFYPSDAKIKFEEVVQTKKPFVATVRPFNFPDHPEWGITYWDWILTPVLDDTGEVEFLVFSLEDVTEHKRADEALKAAHQYNRSLIEASLDPLITINPDGKVTDVNSATELATGVPREQLIGSDFTNYFTEPEKAREGYRTVFSKGTVRDYPLAMRHRFGVITDVLYNATIYRNEAGEIEGVFAAARDITERKRAEEALKESENRLRVLSSQLLTAQEGERKRIAVELHDSIGQMLTAIKFKAESYLGEKKKSGVKDKPLGAIIQLIQETMEEVRRMQMDLRPSTLDDIGVLATLGWFCREYQKVYSHIHVEKEIGLQEDEVSTSLKTVLYRLTQEAMNNIAKHSRADFVHLSLRKQEKKLEWAIEDNGVGFDLETILSSSGPGRGMGLSSMRERTELSGGTFLIESIQGKGTTLRASWPL